MAPPLASLAKGDKLKLIRAVSSVLDLDSLKAALLDMLGVNSVDMSDATEQGEGSQASPLHTRTGAGAGKASQQGSAQKAAGTQAKAPPAAKASEAKPQPAPATRPGGSNATLSSDKGKKNGAAKAAANQKPASEPSPSGSAAPLAGSAPKQGDAAKASSTQTVTPEAGQSQEAQDPPFEPVLNKRNANKAKKASEPQVPDAPAAKLKPKPLVLEGASEDLKASPLEIMKVLRDYKDNVAKTVTTKRGTILVFPKKQEDGAVLLQATLPDGLVLRQTKATQANTQTKHYAVIVGIHPSLTDEELTEETARSCKRISSARQGGSATWKVKVECSDDADCLSLIKSGIEIGLQKHRVVKYNGVKPLLQCYKCQAYGHVASACKGSEKCRHCGGDHNGKDCSSADKKCANCSGNHAASDFQCPNRIAEVRKADTAKLTYAQSVKKGGEQVDCVRLACSISMAMQSVLCNRLGMKLTASDICNDVANCVALYYKADVRGEHVHHIACQTRKRQGPHAS